MSSWNMRFKDGKPCSWDGDPYDEEVPNYVFEADLCIYGYSRGRSSAIIQLVDYEDRNSKDRNVTKYNVFMSDIVDIVREMNKGRIIAEFTWVKKGSSYGIKIAK
ncbi:MAG: hypothetical protein ACRCX5_12255 [Bacteroidales bacterium]